MTLMSEFRPAYFPVLGRDVGDKSRTRGVRLPLRLGKPRGSGLGGIYCILATLAMDGGISMANPIDEWGGVGSFRIVA